MRELCKVKHIQSTYTAVSDSIDESLTPAAVALIERWVEYNINQVKHTDPRGQRKEHNLI